MKKGAVQKEPAQGNTTHSSAPGTKPKSPEADLYCYEELGNYVEEMDAVESLLSVHKGAKDTSRETPVEGEQRPHTWNCLSKVVQELADRDYHSARGAQGQTNGFVLWEIFSGTAVLGRVMREEFGWDVYMIDKNRDLCRKTGATCCDVRQFDFDRWPRPNIIFAAPPCTGWSNSQKRDVRQSKHMQKSRGLAEWTLGLVKKYAPDAFIIENPRHTKLAKQPYMKDLMRTYWSFCRYGRPYQKQTVLYHSDDLDLNLLDCNHTAKHEVKLGGNYNGFHRYKKRNVKMSFPEDFCKSLGAQLTKYLCAKRKQLHKDQVLSNTRSTDKCFRIALKTYENPVNIHGVIVPYDPDTGSTGTYMTQDTLDYIIRHAKSPIDVHVVKPYTTELANGSMVTSTKRAWMDLELISALGSTILKRVRVNVMPGPTMSVILLGKSELRMLGIEPMNQQVHEAVKKRVETAKKLNERLPSPAVPAGWASGAQAQREI